MRTLALALWALAASTRANGPEHYDARVVRVFDGDTVWVQPAEGGRWRKLRLDGIDAPEICQPGGLAARDALGALVLGQVVQVIERASDDHGRGIVRLSWRGEDINRWLVQAGHAWAHRWRGRGPYLSEEDEARRERRGLFAQEAPQAPRDFRHLNGPCVNPPRALSAVR